MAVIYLNLVFIFVFRLLCKCCMARGEMVGYFASIPLHCCLCKPNLSYTEWGVQQDVAFRSGKATRHYLFYIYVCFMPQDTVPFCLPVRPIRMPSSSNFIPHITEVWFAFNRLRGDKQRPHSLFTTTILLPYTQLILVSVADTVKYADPSTKVSTYNLC